MHNPIRAGSVQWDFGNSGPNQPKRETVQQIAQRFDIPEERVLTVIAAAGIKPVAGKFDVDAVGAAFRVRGTFPAIKGA